MPSPTIVLVVIAVYLGLCLVLGMWPGRSASATTTGFVAGDRALGLVLMYFITGASIFSAFAFLGAPGWAYSRGVAVLYILGYGAFGFLPFYFLGPRAARVGRRYGLVTQAEMVARRFEQASLAGAMALVSVLAFVPYLALQMKGAGYVVSVVTEGRVPEWAGAALVYGIVAVYVLHSGVLGVGWTNTFQGIFMMALAWGLGLWLPRVLHGGVGEMFEELARQRPELLTPPGLAAAGSPAPWSWGEYSSAVLVSAIGFSCWPHLFMKAFSARDGRTIRRTVVLYPTFQVFLVPIFLIGFAGVLFASHPAQPDQILPYLLMHMQIPALVVGLFCAGALAASMSSGDAMAHAGAAIAVRDGLVTALGREMTPLQERRWIRWMIVVVLVLAYVVATVYRGSLVLLLLSTYGAVVQFAPGLVASLYARRASGRGVLVGLLLGIAVTVLCIAAPGLRPWPLHAGLYGLVANVAALLLVSARSRAVVGEEFLATAAGGEVTRSAS